MEFKWIEKQTKCQSAKTDVSVTINSKGKNGRYTNFIFRNNSFLRFSKNNKVVFAIVNDRIYFKEGNEKTGFSLTNPNKDGTTRSFKCDGEQTNFLGDYDLLWDSKEKLNYIDLNKKKKWDNQEREEQLCQKMLRKKK